MFDGNSICPETPLVDEVDALAVGENEVRAALLLRVAALDESGAWRPHGAASMAQWLVARHGHAQSTAHELVRVARSVGGLPEVFGVYREGGLSWDQLRAVTRLATPDDDAEWAERAPGLTASQLNALRRAPTRRQVVDVHRERSIWFRFGSDEPTFDMRTRLVDTDGALVLNALMRYANLADPDPQTATFENLEIRLADALVQMASQSLGADGDPERATVVLHTDLATLRDPNRPGALPSRMQDGPVLSTPTLQRLTCDARLQLVLADHKPVGVGRTTRTIPAWLRRVIERRDPACRFPGCERIRWTHAHHIIHWSQGGPTDLDNLIRLCGYHHRLVHEHGWRISGDPNGDIAWVLPNGRPLRYKPLSVPLGWWREVLARQPPIVPSRPDTVPFHDTS